MLKLLKLQVKMLFFVVFSFVFLFSAAASADVTYITDDGRHMLYFSEDSSGKINRVGDVLPVIEHSEQVVSDYDPGERKYPYYARLHAFKHKGEDRVLIFRRESDDRGIQAELTGNKTAHLMIYDPEDFSKPLASNDFAMYSGHDGGVAEFGNNILIGKGNVIHEMNPETCELVGKPYFISDYVGSEVDILVHDSLIFAGEAILGGGTQSFKLEIMNKLGNVTGSISNFLPDDMISSGKNLYFRIDNAMYRVNYNELKNKTLTVNNLPGTYATKVADNVNDSCSDGNGGFYYAYLIKTSSNSDSNKNYDELHIYHYDGTKSTEVYNVAEESTGNYRDMRYDPSGKTLFLISYFDNDTRSLGRALKENSSGKFQVIHTFNSDRLWKSIAVISKTASISIPSEPAEIKNEEKLKETLASKLGVKSSDITIVSQENYKDKKTPTSNITQAIKNDGFTISETLNSINVTQTGYNVMAFNVPSSLQGKNASNFKIYLVNSSVYTNAVNTSALPSGYTTATVTDSEGNAFSTVPATILAAANLQTAGEYGVYAATASGTNNGNILGSSGAGCNSGLTALSVLLMASMLLIRKKI